MKPIQLLRILSEQVRTLAKVVLCMSVPLTIICIAVFQIGFLYNAKIDKLEDKIRQLEASTVSTANMDVMITKSIDDVASDIQSSMETYIDITIDEKMLINSQPDEVESVEVDIEYGDGDTVVPTVSVTDTNVLSNNDFSIQALKDTVSAVAPALVGIEGALLDNYKEYGIDPIFQLAVFCLESGYGTSRLAQNKNNICGYNAYPTATVSTYDNATYFESKSDCVLAFGKTINENYINNNLMTVSSIAKKYCPPNHISWTENVTSLQSKITSMYDKYIDWE